MAHFKNFSQDFHGMNKENPIADKAENGISPPEMGARRIAAQVL
jgi:hypothetical protein